MFNCATFVLLTLILTSVSAASTTLGPFAVGKRACRKEPFCQTRLTFVRGPKEVSFHFLNDIEAPSTLDAWNVSLPGVSKRFVLAIAGSPGGSDVTFEISFIGLVNGEPTELSPRLTATSQDALCVGRYDGAPGFVLMNFIWRDEAHYRPHFYAASTFRWNGSAFVQTTKRATKIKQRSWRAAARELRVKCQDNYVEKVLLGNDL